MAMNRREFLRLVGAGAAGLSCPGLAWAAGDAAGRPPNFVFILGEGQGWASTSVQMDDAVPASRSALARTPSLEALARQGMRFAQAYAPAPRCTPARAALFTGINPARLHITFVSEGRGDDTLSAGCRLIPPRCLVELSAGVPTIGDVLKRAGYATAHFGKWHVGRVSPSQHGFDENDGATSNIGPNREESPNPKEAYGMAERGMAFMARQAQAGRPFYLQMSHYAARGPEGVLRETYDSVSARAGGRREKEIVAAAAMEDVDKTIGMVLKRIEELGIAGSTYVIYTADHGTPGPNGPLAGGKGWLAEGGIRVPLIVRGPGVPAGACSHTPAIGADLFPTLAALAGVKEPLPAELDGGSLAAVLSGGGPVTRRREELIFHYPHYDHGNEGPQSAVTLGSLKLIRIYETGKSHLFDLSKDLGEENDLAGRLPEKAAALERLLADDLKAMDAQMPTANPGFDPGQAPVAQPGGRKGRRNRQ